MPCNSQSKSMCFCPVASVQVCVFLPCGSRSFGSDLNPQNKSVCFALWLYVFLPCGSRSFGSDLNPQHKSVCFCPVALCVFALCQSVQVYVFLPCGSVCFCPVSFGPSLCVFVLWQSVQVCVFCPVTVGPSLYVFALWQWVLWCARTSARTAASCSPAVPSTRWLSDCAGKRATLRPVHVSCV